MKFLYSIRQKEIANIRSRAKRGEEEGSERSTVLLMMLFMVFQRVRGFEEDEWMNEE